MSTPSAKSKFNVYRSAFVSPVHVIVEQPASESLTPTNRVEAVLLFGDYDGHLTLALIPRGDNRALANWLSGMPEISIAPVEDNELPLNRALDRHSSLSKNFEMSQMAYGFSHSNSIMQALNAFSTRIQDVLNLVGVKMADNSEPEESSKNLKIRNFLSVEAGNRYADYISIEKALVFLREKELITPDTYNAAQFILTKIASVNEKTSVKKLRRELEEHFPSLA